MEPSCALLLADIHAVVLHCLAKSWRRCELDQFWPPTSAVLRRMPVPATARRPCAAGDPFSSARGEALYFALEGADRSSRCLTCPPPPPPPPPPPRSPPPPPPLTPPPPPPAASTPLCLTGYPAALTYQIPTVLTLSPTLHHLDNSFELRGQQGEPRREHCILVMAY